MPTVHIPYGPQGAGKTTYSFALAAKASAVRFSIDEWMIDLFGADLPKTMSYGWVVDRVQRCEKRIWISASEVVRCGTSVVLDLGFMKAADRRRFAALAEAVGATAQRHYLTASKEERRARVSERNKDQGETYAFEITPAMFAFTESQFEPPTQEELALSAVPAASADGDK